MNKKTRGITQGSRPVTIHGLGTKPMKSVTIPQKRPRKVTGKGR